MIANAHSSNGQALKPPPLDLLPMDGPFINGDVDKTVSAPSRRSVRRTKLALKNEDVSLAGLPCPISRGPVEVLGQENETEQAILIDPLSREMPDQEAEAEQNQEEQGSLPARTRPLGFFAQEEDSPSFYLSLSDLMSLLLVFFVLIFSLTNPFAAPDGPSETPNGVAQREVPMQMPEMVQLPDPQPLPAQMTKGIMAVSSAGSGDPALISETKALVVGSMTRQTRRSGAGSTDAFLDRALLRLVTTSKPLAPEAVIKEESRLSQLVAQMDAEVRAQTGPGVEVESRQDSLVVRLPEAITFDQGRAVIKPAMASVLGRLAEVLARRDGYKVFVTGHTDNVPIRNRDFASNWELSAARAAAVARALMAKGSNPSRFTISGQADQRPIATNGTAKGRQQNRRVEIELRPVG